jgi:uncharacterized membrane protein YeaQ/YmgE (transglycosylase-associated protein family)
MEAITATHIYWFISIGLLVGLVMGIIMGKEGVSLEGNIIMGAIGAVIMGIVGITVGFSDGVWFSFVGLIAFLFLVNVFHQHHEEDILGEIDHHAKIL